MLANAHITPALAERQRRVLVVVNISTAKCFITHTRENLLYWVLRGCQRSGMPPLCKHSQDSISSPLDYNLAHTLLEIELGGNIAVCFFAQDVAFFFYCTCKCVLWTVSHPSVQEGLERLTNVSVVWWSSFQNTLFHWEVIGKEIVVLHTNRDFSTQHASGERSSYVF